MLDIVFISTTRAVSEPFSPRLWLQGSLAAKWGIRLLNAGSAALDQNAQHNDKENTGNYPDNRYTLHDNPPSSCN
jgi:hypothetical protein